MVKFSLCLLCFSVSPCLPLCEFLYDSFLFYFGNNVICASLFALRPFYLHDHLPHLVFSYFCVYFMFVSLSVNLTVVGAHSCCVSLLLLCWDSCFFSSFLKENLVFVNKVTFCWPLWPYHTTNEFRRFAVVVQIEDKFRLFASFILQTSKTDRNLPVTNSRERDTV